MTSRRNSTEMQPRENPDLLLKSREVSMKRTRERPSTRKRPKTTKKKVTHLSG